MGWVQYQKHKEKMMEQQRNQAQGSSGNLLEMDPEEIIGKYAE